MTATVGDSDDYDDALGSSEQSYEPKVTRQTDRQKWSTGEMVGTLVCVGDNSIIGM
jgi:hypothetical protein